MILSHCSECKYHHKVEIEDEIHSRCLRENCLTMYTKCFTEEAIRQFIKKNMDKERDRTHPALEICYPRV